MVIWLQWLVGVIAGVGIVGGALWLAFGPFFNRKPRASGRDAHKKRGNDGWNDTNHPTSGTDGSGAPHGF